MSVFGTVPPEPPQSSDLSLCAAPFAAQVQQCIANMEGEGWDPVVNEAMRSEERQEWLYGFGRQYDDGRGPVTNAPTARKGWHFFGLAADIISKSRGWDSRDFFDALAVHAGAVGLVSGSSWKMQDRPHVQWAKCRTTPSQEASDLYDGGGNPAVWQAVGAT